MLVILHVGLIAIDAQGQVTKLDEFSGRNLEDVLHQIETKYPVKFFYDLKILPQKPVDISFSSTSIVEGLNEMLAQYDLKAFPYSDYAIVVGKKDLIEESFSSELYNAIVTSGKEMLSSGTQSNTIIIGEGNSLNSSGRTTLGGLLIDVDSKEPVIGSVISFDKIKDRAVTGVDGRFEIKLPIGVYEMYFKSIDYSDMTQRVIVKNDGEFSLDLTKELVTLDEIVVSSSRVATRFNNNLTGLTTVSALKIKEMPSFMGEPDVIKSLLFLPGVSSIGEGASGFNVRGGNADENLITIGETMLFNSNHAMGFFGAINADVIEEVKLYKGAMPAYFGGRLSSVLDVELKEADNEKFKMDGGIGPVSGKLTLEIPLAKGKSSLLVGGRSSYSDWLLQRVNIPDVKNSSLFFYDINVHYVHHFNNRYKLVGSIYSSKDDFRFSDDFGFDYSTNAFSVELTNLINQKLSSSLSVSYATYASSKEEFEGNDASIYDTGIDYFKIKEHLVYEYSDRIKFDAGGSLIYYDAKPGEVKPGNEISVISNKKLDGQQALEGAGFVNMEYDINEQISFSTGLRLSYYNFLGTSTQFIYSDPSLPTINSIVDTLSFQGKGNAVPYATLEPRLSFKWKINEDLSFKSGYSRTAQYLFQLSNTDTATPVDVWTLSNQYLTPQRAHNFSVELVKNSFSKLWTTSIGGFFRKISDITDYRDFADLIANEHLETEVVSADGRAYGLEFNIKRNFRKLTGDIAYTLSRSERRTGQGFSDAAINNGNWYPANYDKTHDLSVTTKYKFNSRHSLAFNFTYATGRPTTAPLGFFDVGESTSVPIYSQRNALRISDYHRLDITYSLGQGHRRSKSWKSSWTFGVYNVYGRRNAYSVFFTQAPSSALKANKFSVLGSAFPAVTYHFNFQND